MPTFFGFLGLILGAWAVRGICMQAQSNVKKIVKSIIAAGYFLGIGGLGGTQPDKQLIAIILLLVGAALVWFSLRGNKQSSHNNTPG